jgi:hypothetical protein
VSTLPSYHYFLGNGVDAVLIGRSGAMSPLPACGLDRCYWYKADLYYADSRRFAPEEDIRAILQAAPGGTNFQLAPLARAWYDVRDLAGEPLALATSEQVFDPASGELRTVAWFGPRRLEVRTVLSPRLPALFFDLHADDEVIVRAWVGAGTWPEDSEQTNPVTGVSSADGEYPGLTMAIGSVSCGLYLVAAGTAESRDAGHDQHGAWTELRGRHVRWWAVLESTRYPEELGARRRLPAEPEPAAPQSGGEIEIPDPDYQRLHSFSMYMFQAIQHRHSGGIPVNNLRRTYNSHLFWDGAFVQRALLEAGYVAPAREAWRFLGRTREVAAANARATFDAPGLHWDWETTDGGERAYLPFLDQRYQVHNTPLLAHMILADFQATRDRAVLVEGYDLLAGAATFVLHAVLVERHGSLATRPLIGASETTTPVVNDGATVAACLRLLEDVALAARLLGREDALSRRCRAAAARLRPTLGKLFNGRYFQAASNDEGLSTSSLAPIYPAGVVAATDARAVATTQAYRVRYVGRLAGHGTNGAGFPWSAGVLARVLAYQGQAGAAWEQLDLARAALCAQGGSSEYVDEEGRWNMQYFSTAQATLCGAIHALLLQRHGGEARLFPALPSAWRHCAFRGFLLAGMRLDATYEPDRITVTARNATDAPRHAILRTRSAAIRLDLAPGATRTLSLLP